MITVQGTRFRLEEADEGKAAGLMITAMSGVLHHADGLGDVVTLIGFLVASGDGFDVELYPTTDALEAAGVATAREAWPILRELCHEYDPQGELRAVAVGWPVPPLDADDAMLMGDWLRLCREGGSFPDYAMRLERYNEASRPFVERIVRAHRDKPTDGETVSLDWSCPETGWMTSLRALLPWQEEERTVYRTSVLECVGCGARWVPSLGKPAVHEPGCEAPAGGAWHAISEPPGDREAAIHDDDAEG